MAGFGRPLGGVREGSNDQSTNQPINQEELEVGEDGTDDEGVVDEGDDPASTAAIGALEDVGAEGALHKFCPQQPAAQRSVGVGPRVAAGGGDENQT